MVVDDDDLERYAFGLVEDRIDRVNKQPGGLVIDDDNGNIHIDCTFCSCRMRGMPAGFQTAVVRASFRLCMPNEQETRRATDSFYFGFSGF